MISWIQITFQKHFRTIFAVLLAVTIISFIMTIGASPGIGRAENRIAARPFYDLNLANADDQARLLVDARVSALFQVGYALDGEQLQPYAMQRYASLYLANQLHIPGPTPAQLTDFIKAQRVFLDQNGEFDAAIYNRFRDSLKGNPGLNEGTVSRVLSDDFRAEQVRKLIAGPGYVLPSDVAQQLLRADTTWVLDLATVDYTSFKPSIEPTDADLSRYFAENAFRYEIAPRFSGYSVDFQASRYVNDVKISDSDVRAYYNANPARFAPPAATEKDKPAAVGFEVVKDQVAAALRQDRARLLAQKAASDLTVFLFDNKATVAEIPALLAQRGEKTRDLTPFARNEQSVEYPGNTDVATEAFKLGSDRPYTDALATPDGATVIFWKATVPSRQPLLAEVRSKVAADYVENERHRLFVTLGRTIQASLAARVKAGTPFEAAAKAVAQAERVSIEVKAVPAFTLRQPPRDVDYSVFGVLDRLEKGTVSDMAVSNGKGLLVYAAEKKLPVVSTSNPLYDAIQNQLSTVSANGTGSSVMNELVERELKTSPTP